MVIDPYILVLFDVEQLSIRIISDGCMYINIYVYMYLVNVCMDGCVYKLRLLETNSIRYL